MYLNRRNLFATRSQKRTSQLSVLDSPHQEFMRSRVCPSVSLVRTLIGTGAGDRAAAFGNNRDQLREVLFACSWINDASSQPEPPVHNGTGEKCLAPELNSLEHNLVQIVDHLGLMTKVRRRIPEAHDAEALRLEDLKFARRLQQAYQAPANSMSRSSDLRYPASP